MKQNIISEFFVDSLSGEIFDIVEFNENDYGVFFTGIKELGKEGHCYFYGSEKDAIEYCKEKNKNISN